MLIFNSIWSDLFGSPSKTIKEGKKCARTLLVNGLSRSFKVITKL